MTLEPRRPAAVWRIRPLRYDALQPHAADMGEHGRAVTRQMLSEPDGSPLGPAEQFGEPPLAIDQRQVAQVVAVMLDQVECEQHHLMAGTDAWMRCAASTMAGEAVGPVMAFAGEAADARAVPAHHQPVAIVLDLMDPQRAGRWPGHLRRLARFDEAGETPPLRDHGGCYCSLAAVG